MYKIFYNSQTNEPQSILKIEDDISIPIDPFNTDYQQYLKWLEAGNTPIKD